MNRQRLAWIWLGSWFGSALLWRILGPTPEFNIPRALAAPSFFTLPLGADTYGRNLLELLLTASLMSFGFAAVCVGTSVCVALAVSSVAPHLPRWTEHALDSVLQFLLAFPSILFAFTVAGILGPGRLTIFVALVLGATPGLTRILWARAREISQQEFIWAARSLGASPLRLALRHMMPHLASLARLKLPSSLSHALVAEASLSFLGLGFPVGEESWGSLLAQARDYLIEAPHISVATGIPLVITLLALDAVSKPRGDGINS